MKIQAKIDRVLQSGKLKAIASVSLDGMFVVKGLKVMDGQKGLFVSMPQEVFTGKNGNKQYSNLFFPMTNGAKEELQTAVLEVYRQHMDPAYRPQTAQSRGDNFYPEHDRYIREQVRQAESREPDYMNSEYGAAMGSRGEMLPMYYR